MVLGTRHHPPPALLALIGCAWVSLWMWGASPAGRYLDHQTRPEESLEAQLGGAALFFAGWAVMILAMMLPTATAVVEGFGRVVRARSRPAWLQAWLVCGFAATWVAAGAGFQLLDAGIHAAVAAQTWLAEHTGLIAAAAFAAAGAYQFTPLRMRCLTACRSPHAFIVRHWGSGSPARDALRIGAAYGASCVGCCWALMLLLFALGMSSLTWMFAVAVVMAAERLLPSGPHLSRPLGVGLLITAAVLAASA